MKKSIAAVSASLLGLSGAVVASAAPAQAAPLPACHGITDHTVSTSALTQPFYMDCIPQFGLGKAEFTITSTDPYPAGYKLDDGHQTVTSSVNTAAAAAYLGVPPSSVTGGFQVLGDPQPSTATSQTYGSFLTMHGIFPIAGVSSVLPANLPAGVTGCFPNTLNGNQPETYQRGYKITFRPVTTTFKETIAGKVWTNVVKATPAPLILGLNFTPTPTTGFDPAQALCASTGGTTVVADGNGSPNWSNVSGDEATLDTSSENSLDPTGDTGLFNFGAFATRDPAVITPAELPRTGVDPTAGGILGGGLLGVGLAAFAFGRRRRRSIAIGR